MSGEVIRGRIRVDARRAVAKLREHQLVDLHHYTHEVARAAVASGAEGIEVEHDADDVILTWRGEPLPSGVLVHLLDHVLTEADDAEGRRLRLLAMGVNAALGLAPSFVDVYAVDGEGICRRARWTPALLSRAEAVEPSEATVPPPAGWGPGATRVHVRRRLGWDVLRRATLGGRPREVLSLVQASSCLEVALVVGGEPVGREAAPLLVRPLHLERGMAPGLSARLEVLPSAGPSPVALFVEQGVELVRYDLDTGPYPHEPHGDLHLPVRVVVSAEQLPTNASRSAIRQDSALVDAVVSAAHAALVDAVQGLVALVVGEGEVPPSVTEVSEDRRGLDEALGAFVCVAVAARQRGQNLTEESQRLLELAVLRDGLGRPTSYAALHASDERSPLYIHRGEPLPETLAPWLRDVVMVTGRRAESALATFEHRDAAPLVEHAMAGIARREAFLAHAPSEVAVPPSRDHAIVKAFEVTTGPFTGLEGEVALLGTRAGRTTVRVFYERRELAVKHLGAEASPLPLDIALAWDARIRVRFGFDGVEDDRTLRSAVWYAVQIGADLVREALARRRDEGHGLDDTDALAAAWVRGAMRSVHTAWAALELPSRYRRLVASGDPLSAAPAWPLVDGRYASTTALSDLLDQRSALCVAETAEGPARDGRLVLVVDDEDRELLETILAREVTWVPYDRALGASAGRQAREAAVRDALEVRRAMQRDTYGLAGGPAMAFERPGAVGVVGTAAQAERVVLHAGQTLTSSFLPRRFGPVIVVADDETVVPTPDWQGVAWSGKTWAPPSVEHELLVTVVAALEGDARAQEALGGDVRPESLGPVGRAYLAQSLAALEQELSEEQGESRAPELVHLSARSIDLPLVQMVGEDGKARWASTGDVLGAHGDSSPIPTLKREPGFASYDWRPLVVETVEERTALRDWFGGRLIPADHLVEERRARAAVETRRRALLARPPSEPFELGDLAPSDARTGRHEEDEGSACVALRPLGAEATLVDVAYQRRLVLRDTWRNHPLPVVARVSLASRMVFEDSFEALTAAGGAAARRLVALAACDLVRARLSDEDDGEAMLDPAFVTLVVGLFGSAGPQSQQLIVGDLLKRVARWPTVQGGLCKLPLAHRGSGEIYVGRARYEPWRKGARPGALDRAIVHLGSGPLGQQHAQILEQLKIDRRDVSDAVDALQRRRAAGEQVSSPKLGGEPAHPALRCALNALGRVTGLSGEIELVDGPPRLVVGDLSGPARDATTHPEMPVRAVVWTETVASEERDARIAKRIDRLGWRLLMNVAERLAEGEDLPPFVRLRIRTAIGRRLEAEGEGGQGERGELEPGLSRAPVFLDTEGRWHDLTALAARQGGDGPIWATSGEPPYPLREDGRVILRLTQEEQIWLRRALPLRNMTTILARTMEAQRRRHAEPVAALRLPANVRQACLWVGAGEGLEGEIGILAPESAELRGVDVHIGRRPLCDLADGPGWPIRAVVDDAAMPPNPFFDGPRRTEDGTRFVERVRAEADALIERVIVAPPGVPASRFIDAEDRARGLRVKGRLWLEAQPGARPLVGIFSAGERPGRAAAPLVRLHGPEGLDRTVPVSGTLLVEHLPREEVGAEGLLKMGVTIGDASHHYATELALEAAVSMLDELADRMTAVDRERIRWSLALLEAPLAEPPVAVGTEGEITARAILDELTERQAIWYSEGRGQVDGGFPGAPPGFVMAVEHNRGLIAALEGRSLRPLLREVGGASVATRAEPKPRPRPPRRPLPPPGAPIPAPSWSALGLEPPLVDPWFSGLVSTVRGWFGAPAPAPATPTLRGEIEVAIAGLRLPGLPVEAVGFSRRGRAIRYQKGHKRLVINRDHPAILTLIPPDGEMSDGGRRLLLAAIVSELNRAHEAVTAAAELEALGDLLERRSV